MKDTTQKTGTASTLATFVEAGELSQLDARLRENMRAVLTALTPTEEQSKPQFVPVKLPCSVCGGMGDVWSVDDLGRDCLVTCYLCLGRGHVEAVRGEG